MKILNFGSLNIDHVYGLSHFVKPGETINSHSYDIFNGGKGLNQSIALAKAGANIHHAGKIGIDGKRLLENLEENNINCTHVMSGSIPTGHAMIQVTEQGENSIILFGGANQSISQDEIDAILDDFREGDFLLLQNEISHIPYLMKQAKSKKMQIAFNPAPMNSDVLGYPLECVDILILNEIEGEEISQETEPENILLKLQNKYPKALSILTLGSEGVSYLKNDGYVNIPALQVNVVDTTAAGDTFIGYFLESYSRQESIQDSIARANLAASIAVQKKGAANSIPLLKDLPII